MYKELRNKIKHSEKIVFDFRGIFFYTLYVIYNKLHVFTFNRLIHFICYCKGVKLGHNVVFCGRPIIHRYPNSSIYLGDNCKFNSAKNSISIGLNQPCAFVTLGEKAKIVLGNNTGGSGLRIQARSSITIGNNVLLGSGCTILDNDSHHSDPHKREQNIIPARPITIEDNVFIGLQCVILKGVTIGKNSTIGAHSVVFNDIPENCIAWGNPCKVVMRINCFSFSQQSN
ncbi:MAG TPA: acyltransferase [Prolixibacteraceae bacterium]|nr:acyltransferase [Prolixibacteraceae bacterium]